MTGPPVSLCSVEQSGDLGVSEAALIRLVRGRTFPTVPMFPYRDGRAGRKAPSRREVLARKYPDGPPYWGRKAA